MITPFCMYKKILLSLIFIYVIEKVCRILLFEWTIKVLSIEENQLIITQKYF